MRTIFSLVILILFSTKVFAAVTYECNYPFYSNAEGLHNVKDFTLTFLIDEEAEKSYIIGELGSSDVQLIKQGKALSLIEITDSGNVMSTAIDDSLHSVHSRNTLLSGKLIPSQYYGSCDLKY